MACALTSDSRRLYSWWWDSHISPKNSKWLQEDLAEMDSKVKSMIKLIEEDADSFARRAEMYYKKRPELMKLVEEFYRAYRALAERYDYVTGELRHAQKTLQAAFPDQEPFTLLDDAPKNGEQAAFGLELFLEGQMQNYNEKDECEVDRLKKAVADLVAEKDSLFVQYQLSLKTLTDADDELNRALEKTRVLEEKAHEAEKEVCMLKETLGLLRAEKESRLTKQDHLEDLEQKIVVISEEAKMCHEQAVKAENEVEKLKSNLLELAEEKEALRGLYAECLEKSYKLELDLSSAQSDVQRLTTEMLNSTKKLKRIEEICVCLEKSNRSLKTEVSDLAKKIMLKDQELSDQRHELKSTKGEYLGLKEMKRRLEKEAALQLGQCADMQKEIFDLKEEISKLNMSYSSLTSQVELTGLDPESFGSSVKYLQDENLRLKQMCEKNVAHEENIKTLLSSLIDQKTVVESSFAAANVELQNLREKSKGLEELCEVLDNEKSNLVVERSTLASQLERVQKRLEGLESRFMQFEKEKETGNARMVELISSLTEKNESESKLKKDELQDELDRAVIAQFENFILHKFVKEVEEENYYLSVENRKHVKASKLADKLISELETEILEQQVEEELLLVEIENLRSGIYQVLSSLEIGLNPGKISTEEIIGNINNLKQSLSKEEDDKHRLLIENMVISTLLGESESHKEAMKDKVKGWNIEAAKLMFDVQVLNTREIVFKSKVYELAEVCESLEAETASKDREIEEMKRKESVMEREIEELKAQLCAYTPVIGCLKASISSLEHNLLTVANVIVPNNRKAEDVEVKAQPHHDQCDPELTRGQNPIEPSGISDLIEFQTRIAALEKVIAEDINIFGRRKSPAITIKTKLPKPETEKPKSNDDQTRNKEEKLRGRRYLTLDNLNITKTKELSEVRDIPLDQASDGSSSANSRSRSRSRRGYLRSDDMLIEQLNSNKLPYEPQIEDPSVYRLHLSPQDSKKGKLLQRLASDAHKLANLETTVKDLTQRLEAGKKGTKPTVKQQLEEAEETMSLLANVNVEHNETWKCSERMKSVQLDVQKIQCVMLKQDNENEKKGKGKGVILRELIHRGRNNSGRMRRRRLCGCFASSPSRVKR